MGDEGMRGVKIGMGARGCIATTTKKQEKQRQPPTTHIHTLEATHHPTPPTRIAHRLLAAPTGKNRDC